jgi:hypothetical protein
MECFPRGMKTSLLIFPHQSVVKIATISLNKEKEGMAV